MNRIELVLSILVPKYRGPAVLLRLCDVISRTGLVAKYPLNHVFKSGWRDCGVAASRLRAVTGHVSGVHDHTGANLPRDLSIYRDHHARHDAHHRQRDVTHSPRRPGFPLEGLCDLVHREILRSPDLNDFATHGVGGHRKLDVASDVLNRHKVNWVVAPAKHPRL